jgi:hypothetical protein
VREAYRLALSDGAKAEGREWRRIDERRKDVHAALLADSVEPLRQIFRNPLVTDLYYGTDNLCRAHWNGDPDFISAAFASGTRAAWGEWQAARLREVLSSVGGTSVVEIGPGVGHTVYFAFRSGLTDYTTVDLPLGMVAQACFLGAMLGPEALWFDGENVADMVGRVRLFCNHRRLKQKFDVALNADSLPEMSLSAALAYAAWINQCARVFISINHERKAFSVAELARLKFVAHHSTRAPWPLRPGWFEETFWLAGMKPPERSAIPLRIAATYRRGRTILNNRLGIPYVRSKQHRPISPNAQ